MLIGMLVVFCIGFGLVFANHRLWWRNLVISFAIAFLLKGLRPLDNLSLPWSTVVFTLEHLIPVVLLAGTYRAVRRERRRNPQAAARSESVSGRRNRLFWGWVLLILSTIFFFMSILVGIIFACLR